MSAFLPDIAVQLSALAARATREDDVAWLAGSTFRYGWNENRLETTAMALRALVASNPQHDHRRQVAEVGV